MAKSIATQLKQKRAFSTREEEALLAVRMAAARLTAPWAQFLKTKADLSTSQYNVLRILRGSPEGASHAARSASEQSLAIRTSRDSSTDSASVD